jgi:dienelactone hydrolase
MNDYHSFILKILRITSFAYNEPAAMDARRRIAAFFHTHLDG